MPGHVFARPDPDYTDLKKIGRITIQRDGTHGVAIVVDGFDFEQSGTCRQHNAKAIAWARDVLNTELQALRLIPGGHPWCRSPTCLKTTSTALRRTSSGFRKPPA
ncbi:hypothetical protein PHO31112_05023 [Pandoraea horticolens]|uniref:Uncharacterized protein n=1 Tax=Pandoraea horticolens TaxID=2508298 RepID=A0A5E4Z3L1_9BURK|nr:hypothetical protein PHO31112_05023 [Pandoraea horticolens]